MLGLDAHGNKMAMFDSESERKKKEEEEESRKKAAAVAVTNSPMTANLYGQDKSSGWALT